MSMAAQFLSMYDSCKRARSPETCRQVVARSVPAMVDTYLTAYDGCLQAFTIEKCRSIFAPGRSANRPLWFFAGLGLGLLLFRK